MRNTIETLREDVRRRLRREIASIAIIVCAACALIILDMTGTLPAIRGDAASTSFVIGCVSGLLAVAGALTVKRATEMRRALADDAALRRLHAKENDELQAHLEREAARTFVQILPALVAVAVFVGALVSTEAMLAAAATAVFLSLALLAIKIRYRWAFGAQATD